MAMHGKLVDADDPVTVLLQELDDVPPAGRIVPVLRLRRALRCDADIAFADRPRGIGQREPGRGFGRIDAQDVARGAMQANQPEIARLLHALPVIEEQSHIVGGIVALRLHLLVVDEGDVGVRVAEQRNEPFGHRNGQAATVIFLEAHGVGKPAERVTERAHRQLHQHVAVGGRIIVLEDLLLALPDLDPDAHEVALAAVHPAGLDLRLEQDVVGVDVAQPDAAELACVLDADTAAVVEVERDALGTLQQRLRRRCRERPLGRFYRGRLRWRGL